MSHGEDSGNVSGNASAHQQAADHDEDGYRVLEDGSQTQMRLAIIESSIPPMSDGPVMHIHEMHDEGFIVTVGRRFHSMLVAATDPKAERQDPISYARS